MLAKLCDHSFALSTLQTRMNHLKFVIIKVQCFQLSVTSYVKNIGLISESNTLA